FNYNSNHLEGNTLTYGHTKLLLLFDKVVADYSLRELEEMKAHDVALKMVKDCAFDDLYILTEKFIKEINEIVLVRPFYKEAVTKQGQPTKRLIEPGNYKKYPNSVLLENGEIFNYVSPEETPAKMGDLIEWYRSEIEKKELHPVQLAALLHYRFVRIHPFDDSNGRTSRLLMNYVLIKNKYAPIVIESSDKKNYLTALNKADIGDLEVFVEYIVNLSFRWQELYLKALLGEPIEEPDDFRKDIELLKRKLNNENNRIEFTLSNEILSSTLKNNIAPLLVSITNEISTFDELFITNELSIIYVGRNEWKKLDKNNISLILEEISNLSIKSTPVILYMIYTQQQFRKYDLLNYEYKTAIKMSFNTYSYEIKEEKDINEIIIKKFYHENISTEEINKFSSYLAKTEIKVIKEATENN
ncbi:MAG: Fic family protein, partial [Chitinophagaceae bacterium]